jgi:hypothetical protein
MLYWQREELKSEININFVLMKALNLSRSCVCASFLWYSRPTAACCALCERHMSKFEQIINVIKFPTALIELLITAALWVLRLRMEEAVYNAVTEGSYWISSHRPTIQCGCTGASECKKSLVTECDRAAAIWQASVGTEVATWVS